jgi:VanZ family protein
MPGSFVATQDNRVKWVVASAAAVAVQLWGLYRPVGPPSPLWFPHADKVEHMVGFGVPLLLVLLTIARWAPSPHCRVSTRLLVLVVSLFALHGVVSELIQGSLYVSRSADPRDVLADWTGIILGVLAYRWLARKRLRAAGP